MKCPVCPDADLMMSDRQGVEIDYCPKCRGVWLDRGELDKIIERSAAQEAPAPQRYEEKRYEEPRDPRQYAQPQYPQQKYPEHQQAKHHHSSDHDYYRRKKKSSFLGELFDF